MNLESENAARKFANGLMKRSEADRIQPRRARTSAAITTMILCLTGAELSAGNSCDPDDKALELFTYAQLAERPTDIKPNEQQCVHDGWQDGVPRRAQLTPIPITEQDVKGLKSRVAEWERNVLVELPTNAEQRAEHPNLLYIGCEEDHTPIDVAVELRLFRAPESGDLVELRVVKRTTRNGTGAWETIQVGGDVLRMPGTDWFNLETARANFYGEDCAFGATQYAVFTLCEDAHRNVDSPKRPSLLTRGRTPILVGHSMGAAATQFIMAAGNPRLADCPRIDGYAFGSIGINEKLLTDGPPVKGRLTSYLSACDVISQQFGRRVQPGHLFTLSGSRTHTVDEIQDDLCNCVRGKGRHKLVDRGARERARANMCLCPMRFSGQMRRSARMYCALINK